MRILSTLVALLVAALLSACAAPASPRMANACWDHRIAIPNAEGNLLTLCVDGSTASGTIRFGSLGGAATVCRQQGVVKAGAAGAFALVFDKGSCESGRNFDAASFQCSAVNDASISCLHNTIASPLVFTRR